jgi:hypothetical protein
MTTFEYLNKKETLLKRVANLSEMKKRLYSHIDISQPMSDDEKSLNKRIASILSELNQLVIERRKQNS